MGTSFCQYLSLGEFEMINCCLVGGFSFQSYTVKEENDGRVLLVFTKLMISLYFPSCHCSSKTLSNIYAKLVLKKGLFVCFLFYFYLLETIAGSFAQ